MGDLTTIREPGSFRDPSGFVFRRDGLLYRQINRSFIHAFEAVEATGCFVDLVSRGWLLRFESVDEPALDPSTAARIIRPEAVPFLSHPYEWSFGALKDAALRTLDIERASLERGVTLKDASAYNIQFVHGQPVLIDHLSFVPYEAGSPWVAYRQFCEHFLAPLALMATRDIRLGQLLRVHLDGVPLDLASRLLPLRTRFSTGLLAHIHFHARNQRAYGRSGQSSKDRRLSRPKFNALLDHLRETILGLAWEPTGTTWADYYDQTNYPDEAMEAKVGLVRTWLDRVRARSVLDLGANTGRFSEVAAESGRSVVAVDSDAAAVERLYRRIQTLNQTAILPLVIDLANPSPALGWMNVERQSFLDRCSVDAVLALALVHHLAIGNNTPLSRIADLFARLGRWAVVEFVPKDDSQVQRLLRSRPDIFPKYSQSGLRDAFTERFNVRDEAALPNSARRLFLFERR